MGTIGAMGMAEQVGAGAVSLRAALGWHLQSNHYPPHPAFMIGVAERAIRKARDGELDAKIRMPKGVEHRLYGTLVPVWAIIDSLHLDPFVDEEVGE